MMVRVLIPWGRVSQYTLSIATIYLGGAEWDEGFDGFNCYIAVAALLRPLSFPSYLLVFFCSTFSFARHEKKTRSQKKKEKGKGMEREGKGKREKRKEERKRKKKKKKRKQKKQREEKKRETERKKKKKRKKISTAIHKRSHFYGDLDLVPPFMSCLIFLNFRCAFPTASLASSISHVRFPTASLASSIPHVCPSAKSEAVGGGPSEWWAGDLVGAWGCGCGRLGVWHWCMQPHFGKWRSLQQWLACRFRESGVAVSRIYDVLQQRLEHNNDGRKGSKKSYPIQYSLSMPCETVGIVEQKR